MIKVGIIGAAGYTAGELIRILIHHPEAEIVLIQSDSQAGKSVTEIHRDLIGDTDLLFTNEITSTNLDIVFSVRVTGNQKRYWRLILNY